MKKLIALALILVMTFALTACGGAPTVEIPKDSILKVSELEDTSSGINKISKDLLDKEYIPDDGIILSAATIGAEKGYRFTTKANDSQIVIELYQFNFTDLPEEGQKTIDSVKDNGKFDMMGISNVQAEMSSNGKYLIVYQDAKVSAEKPDETSVKHKADILEVINAVD